MKHSKRPLAAICLLVAALLVLLVVAVPYSAIQPEHIAIEKHPADLELAYEDFTVTPADQPLSIAGWWMPADNARANLVFLHGGGSSRHSTFFNSVPFYADMVGRGLNVVAIDLRNHGLSDDDASGVQFGRTEHHDAAAAVRWMRQRAPGLPLFLMGISMGGATAIHAAAAGAKVDALILLDPLLDTTDVFARGGTVQTGLPSALFLPSAWAGKQFFGLPAGEDEALALATRLELPILLLQDPQDPVTTAQYAHQLAASNEHVELWLAPPVPADHPGLPDRGGWRSHVMAYVAFPDAFVARVAQFIDAVASSASGRQ